MTDYVFRRIISNSYLNKSKEIKATTAEEYQRKVNEQLAIWGRQEKVQRERAAKLQLINELKEKAELLNEAAEKRLDSYNTILKNALDRRSYSILWDAQKKTFSYPPFSFDDFVFNEKMPVKRELQTYMDALRVPQKSFLEKIIKSKAQFREQKEAEATAKYEADCEKYAQDLEAYKQKRNEAEIKYYQDRNKAISEYTKKRDVAKKAVEQHNSKIDELRDEFESGNGDAVTKIITECLQRSKYPDGFFIEYRIQYNSDSKIIIVSATMPIIKDFPTVKEYKFISSTSTIKEIEFKKNEFEKIYDSMIKQTALRILYEVFEYDYPQNIQAAIFNGWVNSIDRATGQDFTACILSVEMNRSDFDNINFNKIDVTACIRSLKGLYSGDLSLLAPVKPIMDINTSDSRFVASHNVIETLSSGENLATMDWEDFEHLVRELFSKYFSAEGQAVKVTQSSRDGGVDAIAFDSDPIRGGKYVIQAKRYNKVVPVSAVRDLYGTMINEGAVKGILVTTSYFGSDSREFVKDKPISLIDGSNLIHMFSEFGYDVHIELQK